ncbi:MAG: winged helix-turn-helix transcriptional regulator [Ardenticatenaceae bacterium]|nr:winged helix-turn-helix transcriptional regulator [Anaerolineales bacterium]MCB8917854.1 winged helix-turn-helix transcriptional regulator [Ardenticatenaceae bacterium]
MSYPPIQELNLLHANICQALADPKRIQILYALDEQPRNVSVLADALEMPQPTVSRHLRVLRQQSLVLTERDGPAVFYYLADRRIIEVLDTMRAVMFEALARKTDLAEANGF